MSAELEYLDFDLLIESEGENTYARVLGSPVGEASARFEFPFTALELENLLLTLARGSLSRLRRTNSGHVDAARRFGTALYDSVFAGDVGRAHRGSLDIAGQQDRGLRLLIRLGDPSWAKVPWELLYSEAAGGFLALSLRQPLVRYTDTPPRPPNRVTTPLRILIAMPHPSDMPSLDVARERDRLTQGLGGLVTSGEVELHFMETTSLPALQRQLRTQEFHVLHYEGHARLDSQTGEAVLLFEDVEGRGRPVVGSTLAMLLSDHHSLGLVVFDACETAGTVDVSAFSAVAQAMVGQTVPAIIGMQFEMSPGGATAFTHALYEAVAQGFPLDAACAEGRKSVLGTGGAVEWASPAVYMAARDARVFHLARPASVRAATAAPGEIYEPGAAPSLVGSPEDLHADLSPFRTCQTVEDIALVHLAVILSEIPDTLTALKGRFVTISQDVAAALAQESAFNRRTALTRVKNQLEGLAGELGREAGLVRGAGIYRAYADEFAPVAVAWRNIVVARVAALELEEEQRQEISSPYVVGMPLRDEQPVFVGRSDIASRIEGLILHQPAPSLLLYGQRRMGKTSLLNNLGGLLPSSIVPLFVDLQGPPTHADSHGGFLFGLADAMASSARSHGRDLRVAVPSRETFSRDSFSRFYEWLDDLEMSISGHTVLLMLDEFEALDRAFDVRRLDSDLVLGMLRHLIQSRPSFRILLAGSHTLERFTRWSSYLINVQVVKVGTLNEAEARRLIERPVPDFTLRYDPQATSRVLELTRGHPFLLQLLCAEIVAFKNEQPPIDRRNASHRDVEQAVARALESGSMFFYDIERNQIDEDGRKVLRAIARRGEGGMARERHLRRALSAQPDPVIDQLLQHDLIERTRGGYRIQVEMIRRWFAERR